MMEEFDAGMERDIHSGPATNGTTSRSSSDEMKMIRKLIL
jgi:hypothetical protein